MMGTLWQVGQHGMMKSRLVCDFANADFYHYETHSAHEELPECDTVDVHAAIIGGAITPCGKFHKECQCETRRSSWHELR